MGVLPECRKRKTTGYPGPSIAVTRWIGDFLRASAIHIFMCVVSRDDCVSRNPQLSQSRGFWTENRANETGTLTPNFRRCIPARYRCSSRINLLQGVIDREKSSVYPR